MMRKIALAVAILALATAASATKPKTVAELVAANPKDFSILLAAVKAADPAILATLSDPKLAATVFAPTDKAFKRLLRELHITADALLKNKDLLNKVLLYHVVGTPVPSSALKIRQWVQTLLKGKNGILKITKKHRRHIGTVVRLYTTSGGTAKVIKADIHVGHSVVHVINRVLIPK